MNRNKTVVGFTLTITLILFACSICEYLFKLDFLKNINIIADVVREPVVKTENLATKTPKLQGNKLSSGVITQAAFFGQYTSAKAIVHFNTDTTTASLPSLMNKLCQLKKGEKKVVRIAWLGDSMIEGDLLTQTFRKQMQQMFGGYGVGFVPVQSVVAQLRTTVKHSWTGDWKEETFKDKTLTAPLFLSGHSFFTDNGSIVLNDATGKDSSSTLNKYLICGKAGKKLAVVVNGQQKEFNANGVFNRLLLDSSASSSVNVMIRDKNVPVYGVSLEPSKGVVVDNFSFRGITGLELGKLDEKLLQQISGNDEGYDLIVMEYGANLMFRPNDKDYSWYEQHMQKVMEKLRKAMSKSEFLVISTSDRAFRYGDNWQSAVGIDSLVRTQAKIAFDNNAAFYNMFASMGGANTIVNWATANPSLANKDYIHPNHRGAEKLGNLMYDAFMQEYFKASKKSEPVNVTAKKQPTNNPSAHF